MVVFGALCLDLFSTHFRFNLTANHCFTPRNSGPDHYSRLQVLQIHLECTIFNVFQITLKMQYANNSQPAYSILLNQFMIL